jgi:Zn-dependent peptidase ImmA (M78 family)
MAEFGFRVDIIPIPNLQRDFEVDGYTSSNLKEIHVDEDVFLRFRTRYRFTLAHELGHIVLHRQIFEKARVSSIDSWIEFYDGMDDWARNAWELQGYNFAGLVLVPRSDLKKRTEEIIDQLNPSIQAAKERKFARKEYLRYASEQLASKLAPIYDVSVQVVSKRLDFDKLTRLIP